MVRRETAGWRQAMSVHGKAIELPACRFCRTKTYKKKLQNLLTSLWSWCTLALESSGNSAATNRKATMNRYEQWVTRRVGKPVYCRRGKSWAGNNQPQWEMWARVRRDAEKSASYRAFRRAWDIIDAIGA